jgi:phosphoribosylanthranilate isomerase
MTWVKICGMTNLEDALVAVDAGADAVGFVFYEKSPRCVTVDAVREIVAKLPGRVEKVGVFVDAACSTWTSAVATAGLTAVQHYLPLNPDVQSHQKAVTTGEFVRTPKFFVSFSMNLFIEAGAPLDQLGADLKHFRDNAPGPRPMPEGVFDTFFLDSGSASAPGGSGKTFDWGRASRISEEMKCNQLRLVVAGGLTPENVGEAIGILRPWGVDVVSGVEASPGKKDPEKVRAFVNAVREMDRKVG